MVDTLRQVLPVITGALLGLALVLIAVAFRLFRRSRTDPFWRRRRQAGQRGMRVFTLGAILLLLGSLACILTLFLALISSRGKANTPSPSPGETALAASPTETPPPLATPAEPDAPASATPDLTSTPVIVVVTATAPPMPTATFFPTFTPNVTPLISTVTPRANARLQIVALDDQISDALTPVNPRLNFVAGTRRIYLFLEFSNMSEGVLWRRALYREGELIDSGTYLWGQAGSGSTYFFFGAAEGFEPGRYEIRLYIGENPAPISTIGFSISPVP